MRVVAVVLALGLIAGVGSLLMKGDDEDYTLEVVMPAATNLVGGSPVQISGEDAGQVTELEARDGKAIITVALKDEFAPLHDGTTARISWKATMGERIVDLEPGKDSNTELRDGALVEGTTDRVELDQVLATLDAPTRKKVQSLVGNLSATMDGSEKDIRNTVQAAGPAVQTLGEVLKALGTDGPAIRSLVTRMNKLTQVLAKRDDEVSGTVTRLSDTAETIGAHREALAAALRELPGTLETADSTLTKVPSTVDAALPLLEDVAPAAARLPGVAKELSPVLRDLRPAVAELRPTLRSLQELLGTTPGLLESLGSVVPQADQAVESLSPVLAHLRPYTPELAGWLSNWGSAASNYDSNGHYLRAFITEGTTSINHNPGIMPPGITRQKTRYPGESEGQRWVDAHGGELR